MNRLRAFAYLLLVSTILVGGLLSALNYAAVTAAAQRPVHLFGTFA
jgi:hypothetical protein